MPSIATSYYSADSKLAPLIDFLARCSNAEFGRTGTLLSVDQALLLRDACQIHGVRCRFPSQLESRAPKDQVKVSISILEVTRVAALLLPSACSALERHAELTGLASKAALTPWYALPQKPAGLINWMPDSDLVALEGRLACDFVLASQPGSSPLFSIVREPEEAVGLLREHPMRCLVQAGTAQFLLCERSTWTDATAKARHTLREHAALLLLVGLRMLALGWSPQFELTQVTKLMGHEPEMAELRSALDTLYKSCVDQETYRALVLDGLSRLNAWCQHQGVGASDSDSHAYYEALRTTCPNATTMTSATTATTYTTTLPAAFPMPAPAPVAGGATRKRKRIKNVAVEKEAAVPGVPTLAPPTTNVKRWTDYVPPNKRARLDPPAVAVVAVTPPGNQDQPGEPAQAPAFGSGRWYLTTWREADSPGSTRRCDVPPAARPIPVEPTGKNRGTVIAPQVRQAQSATGNNTRVNALGPAQSPAVGPGPVYVGAGAVIRKGVRLGNGVVLGDGVTICSGAQIGEGAHIGPGVTVPAHVQIAAGAHVNRIVVGRHPLLPGTVLGGDFECAGETRFASGFTTEGRCTINWPGLISKHLVFTRDAVVDILAGADQLPPGTRVGGNLMLSPGCQVAAGVGFGSQVMIGEKVVIGPGASIGDSVAVRKSLQIGAGAVVASMLVVVKNVPAMAVVSASGTMLNGVKLDQPLAYLMPKFSIDGNGEMVLGPKAEWPAFPPELLASRAPQTQAPAPAAELLPAAVVAAQAPPVPSQPLLRLYPGPPSLPSRHAAPAVRALLGQSASRSGPPGPTSQSLVGPGTSGSEPELPAAPSLLATSTAPSLPAAPLSPLSWTTATPLDLLAHVSASTTSTEPMPVAAPGRLQASPRSPGVEIIEAPVSAPAPVAAQLAHSAGVLAAGRGADHPGSPLNLSDFGRDRTRIRIVAPPHPAQGTPGTAPQPMRTPAAVGAQLPAAGAAPGAKLSISMLLN
ncbi:MAG: hypothetical protein JWP36_24 [Paucimonas sp.]|nr:hypothetical protein [Paucimonas sp.]